MVRPILCYGSGICGHTYSVDIEKIQINFCKKYLKFNSSANNDIVLGECGRLPLSYTYFTECLTYWCQLLTMPDQMVIDDADRKRHYLQLGLVMSGYHRK